jgi:hypothetical protein
MLAVSLQLDWPLEVRPKRPLRGFIQGSDYEPDERTEMRRLR